MIRFRTLITSREGRKIISREIRAARALFHDRGHRGSTRAVLLEAKHMTHMDYLGQLRVWQSGQYSAEAKSRAACRSRWCLLAEEALAVAEAQIRGGVPLPNGFTFLMAEA